MQKLILSLSVPQILNCVGFDVEFSVSGTEWANPNVMIWWNAVTAAPIMWLNE